MANEVNKINKMNKEEMHTKRVLEPLAWLFQLISGLILTVLVTFHFYETHFVSHEAMEYELVVSRLSSLGHKIMYALLLFFVAFHAFNGVRAILLDTNFGAKYPQVVNSLCFLAFLIAFGYGSLLILAF